MLLESPPAATGKLESIEIDAKPLFTFYPNMITYSEFMEPDSGINPFWWN
jgi:hypothetical protein